MSKNIEGKIVVITGASGGLGGTTARYLAKLGATVVLGARRKDRLDAMVKDIQADGGKALAVAVDVTKRAEVEGLVKQAIDTYMMAGCCAAETRVEKPPRVKACVIESIKLYFQLSHIYAC